jgi:nucleoside 2-deoxyribosyltransferase
MRVYLAGPIGGMSDDQARSWREIATQLLTDRGANVLDPMIRDYRGKEDLSTQAIVEGDKADIDQADVVLANCWTPSPGTSMEILYAHEQGKRVITVVPTGSRVSPWITYHSQEVVSSLYRACELAIVP